MFYIYIYVLHSHCVIYSCSMNKERIFQLTLVVETGSYDSAISLQFCFSLGKIW